MEPRGQVDEEKMAKEIRKKKKKSSQGQEERYQSVGSRNAGRESASQRREPSPKENAPCQRRVKMPSFISNQGNAHQDHRKALDGLAHCIEHHPVN